MDTIKRIVAAVALVILLLPCTAFAADTVTSTELIEKSKEFSGRTVTFIGEAIGEVMTRGDHAWVNVNDGSNAMGIWMTAEQAEKIKNLGSYDLKGDEVRITGTFERACREHGGDMDLHAASVDVIEAGHRVVQPSQRWKAVIAFVLFVPAAAFMIAILKRRM